MPQLDVSFVLTDPMLCDSFVVERRQEVLLATGRTHIVKTTFPKVIGVVTQADPARLERRDDGQTVPRAIEVHTKFMLREATIGYQPDRIIWQGSRYLVTAIYPWSKFGAGFIRVEAASVDAMDPPQ